MTYNYVSSCRLGGRIGIYRQGVGYRLCYDDNGVIRPIPGYYVRSSILAAQADFETWFDIHCEIYDSCCLALR